MALPTAPWDSHVGTTTTLAEEATFLSDLAASTDRARVINLGTSAQGRPIRAVIVGPARTRDQIRASNVVMILGSHHGDEWAGREATFSHMLDHAGGTGTETIVYVPTINPDGFSIPSRNLANGVDPNRLWSQSGIAQQTDGTAYEPEQLALRDAILLYHPRLIVDTHEYSSSANSSSGIYRFDPGTVNATGTPSAVISIAQGVLNAMKTAATDAGYTIADYTGSIPDDGATQAWKHGGIPSVFTESPQDATDGLTLRRAQQLNSLVAFMSYARTNAATLSTAASSATWYANYSPTVSDPYDPAADTGVRLVGVTSHGSPSGTTTVDIVRPAGTQPGDLLLLHSANATNTLPSTPAGGWAVWETPVSYGPTMVSYFKWAADTDPEVWSWPVPSSKTSLVTEAWRGVDPDNPKDVPHQRADLATDFPVAPPITTVTDGAVVIVAGGTIGPSGDLDLRWKTDGVLNARATSQLSGTTNSGVATTSRKLATAGTVTPTLDVVETVGRGGILVSALRPAPVVAPSLTTAAALTGSGTLSAQTTARATQSATLTGSGTLSATASQRVTLSAAPSGSGTLSATSTSSRTISAAASGSGTLTAVAVRRVTVAAAASGFGTLTASSVPRTAVSATSTGSGTLTAALSTSTAATATFSGSGSLTASLSTSTTATATFSGSGSLTAETTPHFIQTGPALNMLDDPDFEQGAGTWTLTRSSIVEGAGIEGGRALRHSRTLDTQVTVSQAPPTDLISGQTYTISAYVLHETADAKYAEINFILAGVWDSSRRRSDPTIVGQWQRVTHTLTVPDNVTSASFRVFQGTGGTAASEMLVDRVQVERGAAASEWTDTASIGMTLYGDGTLTADTASTGAVSASLSGSGTLTSAATARVSTAATLSGSGTLSAATAVTRTVSAAPTGSGSLSATVSGIRRTVSGTATGSGVLFASTAKADEVTADFSGVGSLTVTTARAGSLAAALTGSGSLTSQTSPVVRSDVALSGSGSLTASTQPARTITAALTGAGNLDATVSSTSFSEVNADFTGSGSLSTTATRRTTVTAALAAAGSLTATASSNVSTAAALTGSGSLAAQIVPTFSSTATLTGSGALAATASALTIAETDVDLTGSGVLSAVAIARRSTDAALSGAGALEVVNVPRQIAPGALSGTGTLTASVTAARSLSAVLTGSSDLTADVYTARTIEAAFTGIGALTSTVSALGAYRDINVVWGDLSYRSVESGDLYSRSISIERS